MTDALVLFPHQLFRSNTALARGKTVFLVEDALYFRQYAFHKQKLVLHRATMRMHHRFLARAGARPVYIDSAAAATMQAAVAAILREHPGAVHYIDPVDDWLESRLLRELRQAGAKPFRHETPMFLSSPRLLAEQFAGKRRFFMARFYAAQRKDLDVLMAGGKPLGGRWSFDTENRKRLPAHVRPPAIHHPAPNADVKEARAYVERAFPDNPGAVADFAYPTTYRAADRWLENFLEQRFASFGDYEDAISTREPVLFHSMLSLLLNAGLLTPDAVIAAALDCARDREIPLNSLEGFVRQIIGWREYMRAAYVYKGRQQRTRNFWGHERALPQSFWRGETGIEPVDTVIRGVLKRAYAHHIERLMVLGNFMLLCGFRPDDVYRWFMELFIDAYDWVMVPNVYAMALHADGGTITTKPYITGSNYLRKMSDFPRGAWCEVWDGLFWRFIAQHGAFMAANPRLNVMARQLDAMDDARRRTHLARAEAFLERS